MNVVFKGSYCQSGVWKIQRDNDIRIVQTYGNGQAALCAANEIVMGGAASCDPGGFVHRSYPLSGSQGWVGDCFRYDWTMDAPNYTYAICKRM